MKINVKQHPEVGKVGHIEDIGLVHQTNDVIVLYVNLRTKNKTVSAYGGASDSGVQSVWIGGDEIQMELPGEFERNLIFSESARYAIHICIYRFQLVEEMCSAGVHLWEAPE